MTKKLAGLSWGVLGGLVLLPASFVACGISLDVAGDSSDAAAPIADATVPPGPDTGPPAGDAGCTTAGTVTCGQGVCQNRVEACVEGVAQTCTQKPAGTETCDGLDNDCNGLVDDVPGSVVLGNGACACTASACSDSGASGTCTPGVPQAETCNGIDDDCNEAIDDGLAPLTCGTGVCFTSVPSCVAGVPQAAAACQPPAGSPEICGDNLDNDCDGATDERNDFVPRTVTSGFGQDVVVEAKTALAHSDNGGIDGANYVLYTVGYAASLNPNPGKGLPDNGALAAPGRAYQLAAYGGDNALVVSDGSSHVLQLAPGSASSVSLLGMGTGGGLAFDVTLGFSDGSTKAFPGQTFPDWCGAADGVVPDVGRVDRNTDTPTGGCTVSLRAIDLDDCADRTKTLASITVKRTAGSRLILLAVSTAP